MLLVMASKVNTRKTGNEEEEKDRKQRGGVQCPGVA